MKNNGLSNEEYPKSIHISKDAWNDMLKNVGPIPKDTWINMSTGEQHDDKKMTGNKKEITYAEKRILITGGLGFIGSNLINYLVYKYPHYKFVCVDSLTYAGNIYNIDKSIYNCENFVNINMDINDKAIEYLMELHEITDVIHLAAESHVDKSISSPIEFVRTNVLGTVNLLNAARKCWQNSSHLNPHRFINMCTDEIFGALNEYDSPFNEQSLINPHSPYSISKACQYMFGKVYYDTYRLPVINLACGNAIGPNQYPEKLVPLTIDKLINEDNIPIYGEGKQMRDWTNVNDICVAIDLLLHRGKFGELYCIGGDACKSNIDIVNEIIKCYAQLTNKDIDELKNHISFIVDPRGASHDFRYDIDHSKITNELGWKPQYTFERSVRKTVEWYLNNKQWLDSVKSKSTYHRWMNDHYQHNISNLNDNDEK